MSKLEQENRALRQEVQRKHEIVGSSPEIQQLKEQIKIVAPTNGWVLITGENGTGKELVARAIHQLSLRGRQALRRGQLRGHPRGADRERALRPREGRLHRRASTKRRASSSWPTRARIFLDEIADMSLKTQAKILRDPRRSRNSSAWAARRSIRVDVRVIAATNKDLQEEIQDGQFREDLYYRLNVIPLVVPPSGRDRNDIPLLVNHFIQEFCAENHKEPKRSPRRPWICWRLMPGRETSGN
ncbi:MAG: sigma 54-interacting transcriptional regulator [Desulfosudis oleivorans]|nr:sigma 54-interacting transcriptional regulator [Desulfosudis oleivorans]